MNNPLRTYHEVLLKTCAALVCSTPLAMADERPPIELTEAAAQLHASALLIDGHNDLPWEIRKNGSSDFSKLDISQTQESLQTDIPRLRKGGLKAQFWSVWVPVEYGYQGTALGTTIEQIKLVKSMVARYPNDFALALTADDIERVTAEGRIASLIGVEGGHCIEESLSNLANLYKLGARYMTLTHSDTLSWADSGTDEPKSGGLSEFGVRVVQDMNQLGMMVDLSHVSPETMHDALDATQAPIIFSHSSAKAVANSPRNVPDDVLKRVAENDGVVMVNFFSAFVVPEAAELYSEKLKLQRELKQQYDEDEADRRLRRWSRRNSMPRGTIHDVLDHIEHIAKVAGPDHVGIGSDYDGVSVLPTQLEDVSSYPLLTQGMLDRGFSEADIRGILGDNLMRVMRKVEQVAAEKKKPVQ